MSGLPKRLWKVVMFAVITAVLFCIWGRESPESIVQEQKCINITSEVELTDVSYSLTQKGTEDFTEDYNAIEEITHIARKISSTPVMVTFVNDAYLPLVYNWLCNTISMNIHQQVLMITTSHETKEEIKKRYSNVTIGVIELPGTLKEHQSYGEVGYLKLMIIRTRIITSFILNNIETFQFECDFLWIRNPIEILHNYKNSVDAIFTKAHGCESEVNGGFLYLFPTNGTKALFLEVQRLMNRLEQRIGYLSKKTIICDNDNDQVYLSQLLNKQFAGVKTLVLSYSYFPDGKWYTFPAIKRALLKPYMIHNNYIAGNWAKISRLQRFGHWFLNNDSICDNEHVKYALKTFL